MINVVLVDTNVLVYLMIESDRTAAARRLYKYDGDWCSEAFVMVEFSNVIATYVRTRALTQSQGSKLLAAAAAYVPTVHDVANAQALDSAMHFGISAYDARFITLARRLKQKLVTEDRALRAAVPGWTMSITDAAG